MRYYLLLLAALLLTLSACTSAEEIKELSSNDWGAQVSAVFEGDSSSTVEQQVVTNDWFQPNTKLLSDWELKVKEGSSADQSPVYWIRPKPNVFTGAPRHHFLFLYTKPSLFFDESVSEILSVFLEEQVPVASFALLSENPQSMEDVLNKVNDRIDLIFTMGSDATAFVDETYQQSYDYIPVVTVLSKDPVLLGQMPDYEQGSKTNIAYTSVGVPIDVQVSYFKQLVPDLKNMVLLYAKQNSSAVETQVKPLREYLPSQDINMIDVAVEDRTQAAEELHVLMPEAIRQIQQNDPEMKHSLFLLTGSASVANELETINELAQQIPIVTLLPNLVQQQEISPVFGIGVNFDSNSKLAGKYALDILQGGKLAGDLPVGVITPPDLAINFAQARRNDLKIPFGFFESASTIYGPDGRAVRLQGKMAP